MKRALTAEEKKSFLTELAELLEKYSVEIEAEENIRGYLHGVPTVEIADYYAHTLINRGLIDPAAIQAELERS